MGRRATRRARVAAAALLAAGLLTACSLLTSLDGLSGGAASDAAGDTATPIDGNTGEAASGTDGSSTGDADGDAALSASALYAASVLSDHPLGYWRLDETTGTTAKDETGRNQGTFVNAPLLGQPGVAGSLATKLPAAMKSRMMVATGDFGFPGNAPYTVELWAKPGAFRDYQWLAATEIEVGGRHGWSLLVGADGNARYEVWFPDPDGGADRQTRGAFISTTPLSQGAFTHIVVAYTGSVANGYVNGVGTTMFNTVGKATAGGPLIWGCRGDFQDCLDDWVIDELAIYDVALDPARVKAHYDLGK